MGTNYTTSDDEQYSVIHVVQRWNKLMKSRRSNDGSLTSQILPGIVG